jgi:threonine synthase
LKYISTRGDSPPLDFEGVLLSGLASDGGLYLPETWPQFSANDIRAMAALDYPELTARIMAPFMGNSFSEAGLLMLTREAYASFDHAAIAPLKQLDDQLWLMELFHGPTLAFKDMAMQVVGRLFEAVLHRRGEHTVIIGATSGDTGSAAIEAVRGSDAVEIFMLHPDGRVSEAQRRQMTTVLASNVHNIAISGTFDDCQDLVKAMFNDKAFRSRHPLSAVNSINWARIAAQIVYYFRAALAFGAPDRQVTFAVPSGNFGNVFAGYAAMRMGLPVAGFSIGTNRNDILSRFFESGEMAIDTVYPTLSPSMDIQISSNFERLLFELYKGDGATVTQLIASQRQSGSFSVDADRLRDARQKFSGFRCSDEDTLAEIAATHQATGELLDPHSAVGVAAGRALAGDALVVALATAHPAKFPDAVAKATGIVPALPPHLADLYDRPEHCERLPNNLAAIEAFIDAHTLPQVAR